MVLILPLIFNSSCLFSKLLETISSATTTMCHYHIHVPQLFSSLSKVQEFVYPFTFFYFHSVDVSEKSEFFFFFYLTVALDQVFGSKFGDPFLSQNLREFHDSFSRTDSALCIYYLVVRSEFYFLKILC